MRKRLLLVVALAVVLGFGWGFLTHRSHIFPYSLLSAARVTVELATPQTVLPKSTRVDNLLALPYLSGSPASNPELRGVVHHDPDRAFAGLNLYCSREESRAILITMEGEVVHRWSRPGGWWSNVYAVANGDLLVIVRDKSLLRLDKNSKIVWEYPSRAHHGLWLDDESGEIWLLTREARAAPTIHPEYPVLADTITVLSSEGELIRTIDLLEPLQNSPWSGLLQSVAHRTEFGQTDDSPELDIMHTNHVEVIQNQVSGLPSEFRPGNLLVSIRNINSIAVVDLEKSQVVWLWGPNNVTMQHHSVLLDTGRIMLFDNGVDQSRVLELDPATLEITWLYGPVKDFFSRTRGSNQRLANGNTLVTESNEGRVFEITPLGEIVWEFFNHDIDAEGNRSAIFRMTRYDPDELPFLAH